MAGLSWHFFWIFGTLVPCLGNLNLYASHQTASTAEIINGDVFFEILDPAELEYTYRIRPAKDFGAMFNETFSVKNAPLIPISPKFGCEPPSNNVQDLDGYIAFIERGECSFKKKTLMAERAGAKAVIITDITDLEEDQFIEMIDDESTEDVHIPAGFLMGKNGMMIISTLKRLKLEYAIVNIPVNLTFTPVHKMNQPPWLGW